MGVSDACKQTAQKLASTACQEARFPDFKDSSAKAMDSQQRSAPPVADDVLSVVAVEPEQPSSAEPGDLLLCSDCGEEHKQEYMYKLREGMPGQSVHNRCVHCNRLRSRIQRLGGANPDLKDGFQGLAKEDKVEFMKRSRSLLGDSLKKTLSEAVVQSQTRSTSWTFRSTGKYLDEEALRTKYADKPQQLEAIFQNAPSMVHPDRKVQMWQDRDFISETQGKEERINTHKRMLEQESDVKADQQAKREKKGAQGNKLSGHQTGKTESKDNVEQPLAKAMVKKLTETIHKAEPVLLELASQVATSTSPEYKEFVSEHLRRKSRRASDELDKAIGLAKATLVQGRGTKGELAAFVPQFRNALASSKMCLEKLQDAMADEPEAGEAGAPAGLPASEGKA